MVARIFASLLLLVFASGAASAQNSSVFTDLIVDDCFISAAIAAGVEEEDEGGGYWQGTCRGYDDIPVIVTEGDIRYDVDAGVANERFETAFFFNEPHTTIEWRLDATGEAFALIHRFWSTDPEFRASALGVTKIGRAGEPGCMVALISGSTPNANDRATAFADAVVDRIDCRQLDTFIVIN